MCEHNFYCPTLPKNKERCKISTYFSYWDELEEKIAMTNTRNASWPASWSSEIPIDSDGKCLFHSRDLIWKTKHHCYQRFLQLWRILEILDEGLLKNVAPLPTQYIDLRDCYLIGDNQQNAQPAAISLEGIRLSREIYVDFRHTIFQGPFLVEQVSLPQTRLNFSNCEFKGRFQLYQSQLAKVNLSGACLRAGLLVNHVEFNDFFVGTQLQAHGIFEVSSSTFQDSFYLKQAKLDIAFIKLANNLFFNKLTFTSCKIASDFYFLNNQVWEEISFLNNIFQEGFSFSGNKIKSTMKFQSNAITLKQVPNSTVELKRIKQTDLPPQLIGTATEFQMLTKKINAITQRIKKSTAETTDSASDSIVLLPSSSSLAQPTYLTPETPGSHLNHQNVKSPALRFHAFLSFAEEDMQTATALYQALSALGLRVWFSKVHLQTGDSIMGVINGAINRSRAGIALVSHHTFGDDKHFPMLELQSLINGDLYHDRPFFPIYHQITPKEVAAQHILISDRLATHTMAGIDSTAKSIFEAFKKHGIV